MITAGADFIMVPSRWVQLLCFGFSGSEVIWTSAKQYRVVGIGLELAVLKQGLVS
jgi:hypothetical protein